MKTKDDPAAPADWLPGITYRTPEARGPGVEDGSGTVSYGASPGVIPAADPDQEPVNLHPEFGPGDGCPRCADIPDELISPLRAALAGAAGREPGDDRPRPVR